MEPAKRKAGRPVTQTAADKPGPALRITVEADRLLTKQAGKLKIGKGTYASAAIAYFAESGLNPTAERPQGLAGVALKVGAEARSVRVQQVEIGNRLISMQRAWEKSLYEFLKQQQGGTLNYLEQIESNILAHQVTVESSLLSPMVELMVKNNIETYLVRVISERMSLQQTGKKDTEWAAANKGVNEERDLQLAAQMREFIKINSVPKPHLSPKPQVPATPAKAPIPAAPATGAAPK